MNIKKLKIKALELRKKTFNAFIEKGEAHLGGSFSMIEILLIIYENFLKRNDKFILSKAHASFPLCILLNEKGFNTKIKTHLEIDEKNGINCTTGSLGHGLPISIGLSIGLKNSKMNNKAYCMISDGELNCGSTWESIMLAGHLGLKNLYCLIDKNNIQSYGNTKDIINLRELSTKFQNFGWKTLSCDGHNHYEIKSAFKNASRDKNKPKALIFNTIKGKGIKNFENKLISHYRPPTEEELKEILEEN